ncbi:prolipoprotein diacylglyceryl transferase family protein [Sinomicrobium weinanense]|uniref:prolipoprotein diacylglyceryl transferase family protein n=1 Tax=Sinomicrobium weinanense TaxID=2842200 RepID=UPI001C0D3EA9|nr:prolipoprotein diacylglyceryl transferase family protein [Sinomicrobium weinanense]MBU3125397.1 prolipoprotein diacylglyceryl transferase [Sinomicrobium weinanense]
MEIPFSFNLFGYSINIHLVLEYLAFFVAFRYYLFLRKRSNDTISNTNRLSIILGAAIGAFLGSRIVGALENPFFIINEISFIQLLNVKTIMGGLFGGLLGVEIAKKIIGETRSSGDLFVFPIISGIFIGRIGCFLSGIDEFTYGKETSFFLGMDLGDGLLRHPLALYELLFLLILFTGLKYIKTHIILQSGELFKYFMIAYFGFRFFMEFLKPNLFFVLGLSSVQWLCIVCLLYYRKIFLKPLLYAR